MLKIRHQGCNQKKLWGAPPYKIKVSLFEALNFSKISLTVNKKRRINSFFSDRRDCNLKICFP